MKGHYAGRRYILVNTEGERFAADDAQDWDLTAACCISLFWSKLSENPESWMVVPADGSWGR